MGETSQPRDTGYGPMDEFGIPLPREFEGIHAEPARRANRELFTLELEFVQALGNPFYLYNLAVEGYMDDPQFINYLRYLQYWKEKEYARFVVRAKGRQPTLPNDGAVGEAGAPAEAVAHNVGGPSQSTPPQAR
ncbi:suppressor of hpr1 [Tulasnella sp. 403]|nr:suppressor of hpr1 [Tulasnella sp. 403]